jgi:hypothetical protein
VWRFYTVEDSRGIPSGIWSLRGTGKIKNFDRYPLLNAAGEKPKIWLGSATGSDPILASSRLLLGCS